MSYFQLWAFYRKGPRYFYFFVLMRTEIMNKNQDFCISQYAIRSFNCLILLTEMTGPIYYTCAVLDEKKKQHNFVHIISKIMNEQFSFHIQHALANYRGMVCQNIIFKFCRCDSCQVSPYTSLCLTGNNATTNLLTPIF